MFTVYSMDGCGYCQQVVKLLEMTSQSFVTYKLDQHFTIEEFESEFGTKTFPMVTKDQEIIGGASDVAQYFRDNGLA